MRTPATTSPRWRAGALGIALLALTLPAWWFDRGAWLAAWLAAWCFCAGIAMGALAVVWMHTLTGGAWGEPVRAALLEFGRLLPWLALLFAPVVAGLGELYPWAADAGDAGRWRGELGAPAFKHAWLQPGFFALRAAAVLLLWNALALISRQPRFARRAGFAAFALIAWGASGGIAAVDWIMSLTPLWYSSIFGLEAAVGQMLAGMAVAAALACLHAAGTDTQVRRDLGNLLFTFVLLWGYAAFAQFLIIWSENLPHEILWYEQRRAPHWLALGIGVAAAQFAVPFFALLFRAVKDSPSRLAGMAVALLAAHLLELWWLILPSAGARFDLQHLWLLPLATAGFLALCYGLAPPAALIKEMRHA